jgi:hypothetical protein
VTLRNLFIKVFLILKIDFLAIEQAKIDTVKALFLEGFRQKRMRSATCYGKRLKLEKNKAMTKSFFAVVVCIPIVI